MAHPGQEGHGSDSGFAGSGSVGHPQETRRRFHRASCRKLATALGVSKDAVRRVWKEAGSATPSPGALLGQGDPEFESKSGRRYRPVSAASAASRRGLRR